MLKPHGIDIDADDRLARRWAAHDAARPTGAGTEDGDAAPPEP